MGNICCPKKVRKQPPRDLSTLMSDLNAHKPWVNSFRKYLTDNGMSTKTHILDFLIDCYQIEAAFEKCKDQHLLHDQFKILCDNYLSEDSTKPVPVSNSVLREESYLQLKQEKGDLSAKKDLIKNLSRDYSIWMGGLEPAYKNFLITKPLPISISMVTMILLTFFRFAAK